MSDDPPESRSNTPAAGAVPHVGPKSYITRVFETQTRQRPPSHTARRPTSDQVSGKAPKALHEFYLTDLRLRP